MEQESRLQNRDYVMIIDKSGSMDENDCAGGQTRWESMQETTVQLARAISKYDPDGITVIPFAGSFKRYDNVTEAKVKDIFKENSPGGGTVLAPVLKAAFSDYQARKAAKQTKENGEMLLVVTDGAPTDPNEVAREIIAFTKTLDNGDGEYGIQFVQIGKDPSAAKFLKKLDDDLVAQGAKFDIVDTKTTDELESGSIADALIAALDD